MAAAFTGIGRMTSNSQDVARLISHDSSTEIRAAMYLVPFHNCSANVRRVGVPPTARIVAIRAVMLTACGYFQRAAVLFERGVDDLNSADLVNSAHAMTTGTAFIKQASSLIRVLLG